MKSTQSGPTLPLHLKILAGIAAGAFLGLMAAGWGWSSWILTWLKPLGTIFVNLLKLLAVPLVLVSLVDGVSGLRDLRKLSSMGGRTLLIFLSTTVLAVSLGLVTVNLIRPGDYLSMERREELKEKFSVNSDQGLSQARTLQQKSPLSPLVDMVPENLFHALSHNTSMLQVVFFALFMGIAMMSLPSDQTQTVRDLFTQLNRIVLLMVDYVMAFAP
ncbi:MAG: dicarboxylate/amino acid:cation symporter, partial [Bacteroidota bacterium]